jgi:tRNA uridine 5-carboxymethylaminomethyl modification enzyme
VQSSDAENDTLGQYSAQLHRQAHDIRVFMQDEAVMLSPGIDFSEIPGLSYELKERLKEARPMTVVSLCLLLGPLVDVVNP